MPLPWRDSTVLLTVTIYWVMPRLSLAILEDSLVTTTRTDRPGPLPQVERTARTWPLRVCPALNLIGAGVPGAILLFMPSWAVDIVVPEYSF